MRAPFEEPDHAIQDALDGDRRATVLGRMTLSANTHGASRDGISSADVVLEKYLGSMSEPREAYTWLMSCRVLKRGVETFLMNYLCEFARGRGLVALRGEYIPTARNRLVRGHHTSLGFTQVDCDDSGRTTWKYCVHEGWTPLATFITEGLSHGTGSL
jgi:hypothetical protein